MGKTELLDILEQGQKYKAIKLDLRDKSLEELPSQIGYLTNLRELYLSNNWLKSLPSELNQLSKLEVLDLGKNRFSAFPIEILGLKKLRVLNLGFNPVRGLPNEISQLVNLEELNLAYNELATLPREIGYLKKLQYLDLTGSSISFLPPEILAKSSKPSNILNYYFNHLNGERHSLNEAKVIFVGQPGVGKTSLIRMMVSGIYNPQETKTEGISIVRWSDSGSQERLQLNLWDFGGQEIMHATHQFFLTRRSLYVLVLDSRITEEENRVDYWLKIIQSFGGDSPIIIVGNKVDQQYLDIARKRLREKFRSIKDIKETSCVDGRGIAELKSLIVHEAAKLPHIHDELLLPWFAVKTQLEKLNKDYIRYSDYVRICQKNEVDDEISQQTLIGFLHDLGIVLHFQDDPRLEALGILNPQWVTNGVYKILNSNSLFQSKGVLTLDILNNILDLPEYPRDKRFFIIDMMRKFELCYDIEPDRNFLIPDTLPKDEPDLSGWRGDALAFQYHYDVLPNSIISRFIVRMHAFIYITVWRSGVVLKRGDNNALVKADIEDRKIYIWVSGNENTRRDFLSAIRTEFDAIHRTIAKIEVREKVPIPDHPNIVVDYEHLLKLERMGERNVIPEGLEKRLNVRELLNGVTTESDWRARAESMYIALFPVKPATLLPEPKSQSKVIAVMKSILITVPGLIGRFFLDIFGRDKATDSTSVVLGYGLVIVSILLILGIVDLNALGNIFKILSDSFSHQ